MQGLSGVGDKSDREGEVEKSGAWCLARCEWWVVVLLLRWGALGEEQDALGNKCSPASEDEGVIWRFVEKRGMDLKVSFSHRVNRK